MAAEGPSPEVTVSTERAFQGKRLSVRVEQVRLADGTLTRRDIVDHPDSVVIVPVDADGNLLLVRQYRKAPEVELVELPAGVIEGDASPADAAMRELREETGMAAERLIPLGSFYAAPGSMTECLHAFLAIGLREDPLLADHDERIVLERVPFAQALAKARAGVFHDAKTLASLLMAEDKLPR